MVRTLPRFDFRVAFAALSDVGRVRQNNEDVYLIEPALSLFVIADGMGGHAAGEVAARLAVDAFAESLRAKDAQRAFDKYVTGPTLDARHRVFAVLRRAAERANDAVRAEAESNVDRRGMGCTLDAVVLLGDRAFIAHAGDSRVYLARATATLQLTHDHGLHESLLAQGALAKIGPAQGQNPLVNAVGLSPKMSVDCMNVDIGRGDRILLCTDGVHGLIPQEAELAQIARAGSPQDAARSLIDTALVRGGRDNSTVIVIDIAERFAKRERTDEGLMARDLATVRICPLLSELPSSTVLRVLSAAVEVEIPAGETIPRTVVSDQVAYVILDGEIRMGDGRVFGSSALLYPESLLGEIGRSPLCKAERALRALRLRGDDFREVCGSDIVLAASLYERLARHLARLCARA